MAKLSTEDVTAIRAALGKMPYAMGLAETIRRDTSEVVRAFEELASRLVAAVAITHAEHRELMQLQQDITGMRRLFGLGDGGGL
jgi:hypothetical protein